MNEDGFEFVGDPDLEQAPAEAANDTDAGNPLNTGLPGFPQDEENLYLGDMPPQDLSVQEDPAPAAANDVTAENPVNTGLPGQLENEENEKKEENLEDVPPQDEENETEDPAEETEEDGEAEESGSVTNVVVVHPPAQQIIYQADEEAQYHVFVLNGQDSPVPVLVTGILTEAGSEPGIMDKRLEDYTVTEGLLLCILVVLILRMIFDYGRRLF